ncbi:hypothetical protein XENORESO_005919 [Xenotaenia resolanae]|uniref:Uncharacterized protein n=1 Tax=Xenotaenia resolanae TaxID=208358 RepID=A0ABV0WEP5_9TELE
MHPNLNFLTHMLTNTEHYSEHTIHRVKDNTEVAVSCCGDASLQSRGWSELMGKSKELNTGKAERKHVRDLETLNIQPDLQLDGLDQIANPRNSIKLEYCWCISFVQISQNY